MPDRPSDNQKPVDTSPSKAPPPLAERLPDAGPVKPAARPGQAPLGKRPRATIEQEKAAELFLRQANLLRMRGELKQSLAELVKAIDANPFDPVPHTMSADILRNVGRPDDAIREYEKAIELSLPGSAQAAIESKMARLVVEQDELNNTAPAPGSYSSPVERGALSTLAASAIVPGLGQWLAGDPVKAILCFVLWISGVAIFAYFSGPKSRNGVGSSQCSLYPAPWHAPDG